MNDWPFDKDKTNVTPMNNILLWNFPGFESLPRSSADETTTYAHNFNTNNSSPPDDDFQKEVERIFGETVVPTQQDLELLAEAGLSANIPNGTTATPATTTTTTTITTTSMNPTDTITMNTPVAASTAANTATALLPATSFSADTPPLTTTHPRTLSRKRSRSPTDDADDERSRERPQLSLAVPEDHSTADQQETPSIKNETTSNSDSIAPTTLDAAIDTVLDTTLDTASVSSPPPEKPNHAEQPTSLPTPTHLDSQPNGDKVLSPSPAPPPASPMHSSMDTRTLFKLAAYTLMSLGIKVKHDEGYPLDDIHDPRPDDAFQILDSIPSIALVRTIVGQSQLRDASQTEQSQISNGDMAATLRAVKKLYQHKQGSPLDTECKRLELEAPLIPDPTYYMPSNTELPLGVIDLTQIHYELPSMVTRLFLRLYRYVLNCLFSTPDCWPFVQPVPETAFVYHQEISQPMDLSTIEQKIWQAKYPKFGTFEKDMLLIWQNATQFHQGGGEIARHARKLSALFGKIVEDLRNQSVHVCKFRRNPPVEIIARQIKGNRSRTYQFDPTIPLPEEYDISSALVDKLFSPGANVYTIYAMSPFEEKAFQKRGMTTEKQLYIQLNGQFFRTVQQMRENPSAGYLMPRFYIAKNRSILQQCSKNGVLAIFYNTYLDRGRSRRYQVKTDIIVAYPNSELFEIDRDLSEQLSPKSWLFLRPLRIIENATFEINEAVKREHFNRMYTTGKIDALQKDTATAGDTESRAIVRAIARTVLSLPAIHDPEPSKEPSVRPGTLATETRDAVPESTTAEASPEENTPVPHDDSQTPKTPKTPRTPKASESPQAVDSVSPSKVVPVKRKLSGASPQSPLKKPTPGFTEMKHEVWQKLIAACESKGVQIRNVRETYGHLNWYAPNSEGFFKQVYFLDDVVVQTFRQMTMYQRITEVACLMKLKNLGHMAQLKEVLYNDAGDIMGLSMERYQETLKDYTHVHSHHHLTPHQKFNIIYQMLDCMRIIHEAGLAHRDLSEVNFMINRTEGKLEDGCENVEVYLIDFGKSVFCNPRDVRDWFVDVPRETWEYDGDVVPESREELDAWCEALPYVKAKPDHGYKMYRSIQTLPKTRMDHAVLPWLIDPQSEDMYSIGVMIWKTFTESEPWQGILDTDLGGLRYKTADDYRIERAVEQEVNGKLSRQLLSMCVRAQPDSRKSAKEVLEWLDLPEVKAGLLEEWKTNSSDSRSSRKAKVMYGYDEMEDDQPTRPRKTASRGDGKGRGRPKKKS